MEKRKGLRYLLEAYGKLKWEFPNIRLVVVGPGNLDKDCYRIISERSLNDVVFTGSVPYYDLPRYYASAQIFCAPATGRESFGIVLLEAMASGKPVVASLIDGYSTVMTNGEQGLMVEPKNGVALADAIATLIQDSDLRDHMAQKGRETAQQYRWDLIAQKVMNYYLDLTEKADVASEQRSG